MQEQAQAIKHRQLAMLFASAKRYDKAQHHYEAAIALLMPRQSDNQQERDGTEDLSQSIWQLQFELAGVYAQNGNRQAAIATYDHVLNVNERCTSAHVNLAAQLMIDGQLERALKHCERALVIKRRGNKEAHFNMNVILRRLGHQQKAIDRYWGYIEKDIGEPIFRSSSTPEIESVKVMLCEGEEVSKIEGSAQGLQPRRSVSIVCVKWGTKYGSDYVNKLVHGIHRHTNSTLLEVDCVCLTDDAEGIDTNRVRIVSLPNENWKGWWNKIQVFNPHVASTFHRDCVYIDLDTVIVSDLTQLILTCMDKTPFALLKTDGMANEQRSNGYNSSVITWRNDNHTYEWIYKVLSQHFTVVNEYIYKLDHWFEMTLPNVDFVDDLVPHQIVEYKSLNENDLAPPAEACLICFPLQPKPHQATAPWIAEHWQLEVFHET